MFKRILIVVTIFIVGACVPRKITVDNAENAMRRSLAREGYRAAMVFVNDFDENGKEDIGVRLTSVADVPFAVVGDNPAGMPAVTVVAAQLTSGENWKGDKVILFYQEGKAMITTTADCRECVEKHGLESYKKSKILSVKMKRGKMSMDEVMKLHKTPFMSCVFSIWDRAEKDAPFLVH